MPISAAEASQETQDRSGSPTGQDYSCSVSRNGAVSRHDVGRRLLDAVDGRKGPAELAEDASPLPHIERGALDRHPADARQAEILDPVHLAVTEHPRDGEVALTLELGQEECLLAQVRLVRGRSRCGRWVFMMMPPSRK